MQGNVIPMRQIAILPMLLGIGIHAHAEPIVPGAGFQVERYAVVLRPDLATKALAGTETIVIRSTSDRLDHAAFTANALWIDGATAGGRAISASTDKGAIVFALPQPLRKGQTTTLQFRIVGTPARGVTTTSTGIYTSYFACDWMVCLQDVPGDKAVLALDLLLPAEMETAGIGPIPGPDGTVVHRWRSTRPYSSYLYAFAAGSFSRRTVRTSQGDLTMLDATGSATDLAPLLASTRRIAAFLADKAGMPLPDRRYTQVLVPGREAQEAAGFSLIGHGEIERERNDPSAAWIIAHEMAHQWWGNLVTCATWQDFWLNEGVATFMVAAWKEHDEGREAYLRELEAARRRVAQARQAGFDKPLAWDGKYPSLGMRRAVQYSKGALFLAHLRETIGDAAFWNGLRRYTRRHAGGTVTSRDFQTAMELASGHDLTSLFAEWVYGRT